MNYRNSYAFESMFDPEQTTAKLLDAVRVNVANQVNTLDAAAELADKLSEEAARFNECLTTMSNAIRKCENGEITREEMLAECKPCVSALKEKCCALKLADVKTTGDDITENEIAMLREYIVGCKDIVAERYEELQDSPVKEEASEGVLSIMENMEFAMEASMSKEIRRSTEAKNAKELYKNAKKLYSMGSKEKATEYMTKAKKLYEECLKKAQGEAKMYSVKRTVKNPDRNIEDTFNRKVTDNFGFAVTIQYFEDRIDSCKAYLLQWNNKAGKSSFEETKAQLKAERKEERARIRQEKKDAKAARKAAKNASAEESFNYEDDIDYDAVLEGVYNEYQLFIVTEGQNLDARKIKKDYGKQMRALAKEAKQLRKSGKYAEAKKKFLDAADLADELKKEISSLDPSVSSAVLGYFAYQIKMGVTAFLAAIPTLGLSSFVLMFKDIVTKVTAIINTIHKISNKEFSATDANLYIQKMLQYADKMAKAYRKAAGKIASPTAENDSESASEGFVDIDDEEFIESMESFMDTIEMELAFEAALEGEGEDEDSSNAGGIFSRLRAKLSKFRKADTSSERKEAADEVKEAANELAEAADQADTPEKKKRLGKAAKGSLAALATILVSAGLKAAGEHCRKKAEQEGAADPKAISKMLIKFADMLSKQNIKNVGDKIKKSRVERAYKKAGVVGTKAEANDTDGDYIGESFLSSLAFGFESFIEDEDDEDEIDEREGKAFDDEEMIEDAIESAVAVMLAEDGIDD